MEQPGGYGFSEFILYGGAIVVLIYWLFKRYLKQIADEENDFKRQVYGGNDILERFNPFGRRGDRDNDDDDFNSKF